jgi:hypothetical protein
MMGRVRKRGNLAGACVAALLLITPCVTQAGGFAEVFKNFVLGPEAHAGTAFTVQLPENSKAGDCMRCHNGSAGSRIHMKPAGTPMQFRGHMSIDHPVGMDYGQYSRKNPSAYVRAVGLDKRILLEDGKVTCVSCHTTQKQSPNLSGAYSLGNSGHCSVGDGYTTGASQTGLCMSCHAM